MVAHAGHFLSWSATEGLGRCRGGWGPRHAGERPAAGQNGSRAVSSHGMWRWPWEQRCLHGVLARLGPMELPPGLSGQDTGPRGRLRAVSPPGVLGCEHPGSHRAQGEAEQGLTATAPSAEPR